MASSRLLFFFFFCSIVLHLVALTVAQPLNQICTNKQGNLNSAYNASLNHLLTSFPSKTKTSGFYNASYGVNSSRVNAMALCRGDVKPESCRSCIKNSTFELRKRCPKQKEAIIWYDLCMLRYSNRKFFGKVEFGPWFWMYSLKNVSKAEAKPFNRALETLLNKLRAQAASGGSLRKFATGSTATTRKSSKIYALVQCTPDLSTKQCNECLRNATAYLPNCCFGKEGGRFVAPSCNFRYEIGPFYA